MSDYQLAPTRHNVFDKLPVNNEKAVVMIETFIVPLLERAGMTIKVTKTKNTRTLKIQLPEGR